MVSPARSHFLRHSAQEEAQQASQFGTDQEASVYQLQYFQLRQHKAQLKKIQGTPAKREVKLKLLPEYAPYVEGVLAADQGGANDILPVIMVWRIDTGDYAGALEIARYLIKHKVQMVDDWQRPTANVFAEDMANAALTALKLEQPFDLGIMQQVYELVQDIDMHDQIGAKLNLAIGRLALNQTQQFDAGEQAAALALIASQHLSQAIALDPGCGGKTALNQAIKLVEKLTVPANPTEDTEVQKVADQVADTAEKLNQALGGNPPPGA